LKARDILRIFEKLEMEIREGRDTLAFLKMEGKDYFVEQGAT
jgi:FtsZ-binding cell division protein ZapB